jgi:hypothetical protein
MRFFMDDFIKSLPPDIARSVAAGLVGLVIVNMIGRPVYDAFDKHYPEMGEFRGHVERVTGDVLDDPKLLLRPLYKLID